MTEEQMRAELRDIWNRINSLAEQISNNRQNLSDTSSKQIAELTEKISKATSDISVITERLNSGKARIKSLEDKIAHLREDYVSTDTFFPIKAVVFTLMGLIGVGAVTALIRIVIPHAMFPG